MSARNDCVAMTIHAGREPQNGRKEGCKGQGGGGGGVNKQLRFLTMQSKRRFSKKL